MNNSLRKNHGLRMKAFDHLVNLKGENLERKEIVSRIHKKFKISPSIIYSWYSERNLPHGRKGKIIYNSSLFYILGALLGNGCAYRWKITNNWNILVGEKEFTEKYTDHLKECIDNPVKPYIIRSKNIWSAKTNNFELYSLFVKIRSSNEFLSNLLEKSNKKESLLFVEGFFDAEGCIKVIKEKVRKTPKICLDITNTNYNYLKNIEETLFKHLNIPSRYSIQRGAIGKGGVGGKTAYHLRIYKKADIKKFLENISTIKLKDYKKVYVKNWLEREKRKINKKLSQTSFEQHPNQ